MKSLRTLIFGTLLVTAGELFHVQAQDPFTNGLVAFYPFNGNPNDTIGTKEVDPNVRTTGRVF